MDVINSRLTVGWKKGNIHVLSASSPTCGGELCLVSMYVVFGDDLVANARRPQTCLTQPVRPQSFLTSALSQARTVASRMVYTIYGFRLGMPERADVKKFALFANDQGMVCECIALII